MAEDMGGVGAPVAPGRPQGKGIERRLRDLLGLPWELNQRRLFAQGPHGARWRTLGAKHAGETCVIVGNGPSLKRTNMELVQSVPTFGLNRINLLTERAGFSPDYHVVVNRHVIRQFWPEMAAIPATKFAPLLDVPEHIRTEPPADIVLFRTRRAAFSRRPYRTPLGVGCTVTYVAMQVAYWLGFQRVVLVGVDHRFKAPTDPNRLVKSDGPDPNHFDPGYFGKGVEWQLPDLAGSEEAYARAKRVFQARGGRIVDATVGGALKVFPKVQLEEALDPDSEVWRQSNLRPSGR